MARGIRDSALKWLDYNKVTHPLLLDLNLVLYKHLGLKRSVKAVWSVSTLVSYAEERVAGVSPTPDYPGDDVHVMGGDFMTDASGCLVYAYSSKFSSDRPSIESLLSAVPR